MVVYSQWYMVSLIQRYGSTLVSCNTIILILYENSSCHILGAVLDDSTGFSCWGYLILGSSQNQFCACQAHIGQKCESVYLVNANITEVLWFE